MELCLESDVVKGQATETDVAAQTHSWHSAVDAALALGSTQKEQLYGSLSGHMHVPRSAHV